MCPYVHLLHTCTPIHTKLHPVDAMHFNAQGVAIKLQTKQADPKAYYELIMSCNEIHYAI